MLAHRAASGCARASHKVLSASRAPSGVVLLQRSRAQHLVTLAQASAQKTTPAVKIVIQGRRLPVTEAIKQYVESKISRAVSNYTQEVKEVDVTLSARGGDTGTHGKKEQKVDVTIYTVRNGAVRVEESEETLYASIDVVCDKVERKLGRVKERAISKGKWPGRAGSKGGEDKEFQDYLKEVILDTKVFDREEALRKEFAELNKNYPKEVRRTKVVMLDPMTVDEAIEAMEAVGHDFYVFWEMESDSMQIVYRRASEGYGVLCPRKRD